MNITRKNRKTSEEDNIHVKMFKQQLKQLSIKKLCRLFN